MPIRPLLLVFGLVAAACGGKSAADYQKEVQAALDGRDFVQALAVADQALAQDAVRGDAAGLWRLEQLRLDALARAGKGSQVKAELDRLAGTNAKQLTAALYRSLADKAKESNDTQGAIDILTAGDQRFPAEHASFVEAIDALKKGGALDPAQIERLKSLGYL